MGAALDSRSAPDVNATQAKSRWHLSAVVLVCAGERQTLSGGRNTMLGVIWGACVAGFFWSIVTTIAVMATREE